MRALRWPWNRFSPRCLLRLTFTYMSYTHFHAFNIKYLGPTDTKGSRVKITTTRFKSSKTIPFDYSLTNIEDMAAAYLEARGYKVEGTADGLVITSTFDALT